MKTSTAAKQTQITREFKDLQLHGASVDDASDEIGKKYFIKPATVVAIVYGKGVYKRTQQKMGDG